MLPVKKDFLLSPNRPRTPFLSVSTSVPTQTLEPLPCNHRPSKHSTVAQTSSLFLRHRRSTVSIINLYNITLTDTYINVPVSLILYPVVKTYCWSNKFTKRALQGVSTKVHKHLLHLPPPHNCPHGRPPPRSSPPTAAPSTSQNHPPILGCPVTMSSSL